jgi:hypothetical protein
VGRLTVLGGCGQDNVVGLSRTQFLADVGFKLRECELRLRRKIFSVAEGRSRVVVTARPEDPELPSIRGAILCRILAIGKPYATTRG